MLSQARAGSCTVVTFQATQWPCLATRLTLSSIDPVACSLVFFKGKSFLGLRDKPISVAAPKL